MKTTEDVIKVRAIIKRLAKLGVPIKTIDELNHWVDCQVLQGLRGIRDAG